MFEFLRPNRKKGLERDIARKRLEAVEIQRSGDLRAFSRLNLEIFGLENQLIDELNRQTQV
jgi:hypothetical protein